MIDINSREWATIKTFIEKRLADLREKNDNPAFGTSETQFVRGQIKFAKDVLDLPRRLMSEAEAHLNTGQDE